MALTLRLMCGLTTREVASGLLISEPTAAARITRAKKKIAAAGIPYRVPADAELPERLAGLLAVLYLAVTYPTSDGDTIKGTYALAAAPALALCFGFALDALCRRRVVGVALSAVLVASALAVLPVVVW